MESPVRVNGQKGTFSGSAGLIKERRSGRKRGIEVLEEMVVFQEKLCAKEPWCGGVGQVKDA